MRHTLWVLVTWTLIIPSFVPAQDVIRLKRGGVMEGLIVDETEKVYRLQISGGTIAVRRELVAEVVRSENPEDDQRRTVLAALTRFQPRSTQHFLYRDGKRVGYRMRSVKPDVSSEVPGYVVEDRLAFVDHPGQAAIVDVMRREFVDAELRPQSYEVRVATGRGLRMLRGTFEEGGLLRISEKRGNRTHHRMTLVPEGIALPGALAIDLAREGSFEGSERAAMVFDPTAEVFEEVVVERDHGHRVHRGEERSVRILRVRSSQGTLETWADRSGIILREELGSSGLVSIRAPLREVVGWVKGDAVDVGADDLGLELVFEGAGLVLRRPDLTWEVMDGDHGSRRVVSLSMPRFKATLDLLTLPQREGGRRAEEAALKLVERLAANSDKHELIEIHPSIVAGRKGVRFVAKSTRRGVAVTTVAWIFGEGERFHVLLGCAPRRLFERAQPDFEKAADSLEILRAESGPLDPFKALEDHAVGAEAEPAEEKR